MLPITLSIFIALGLALFTADLCNARIEDYSFLDVQSNYAALTKRQSSGSCSIYPCSPNSCSGSSCYLPGVYQINTTLENDNLRLVKRIWVENPRDIGNYLNSLARRPTADNICPTTGPNAYDSFCIQRTFADLPTYRSTVLGMGNTELTGCTVFCVVSARAVYMCHIWEDVNFVPVNTILSARRFLGFQPFLNLISGSPGTTQFAGGPALDRTLFNGGATDNTYAFIMTPRNRSTPNDPNSQEHANEIQQLAAFLRQRIPGIGIQMYNYFTTSQGYQNDYQGVALWQYDANWRGDGTANWRLWFEGVSENGVALGQQVI